MEASRTCANIKSKGNPQMKCPLHASHGEFCFRHWKHPVRWTSIPSSTLSCITRRQHTAVRKLQEFWRKRGRSMIRRRHGPTTYCLSVSFNDKDIYTLDSISTIPFIYRFSYVDDEMHAWTFDIRFLLQLHDYTAEKKNPFTQHEFPPSTLSRMNQLVQWLQERHFPPMYISTETFTAEQHWNQKVHNVLLKFHSFGYSIHMKWFEEISIPGHMVLYRILYSLWMYQLGISESEKSEIIPGWQGEDGAPPLFRWGSSCLPPAESHDLKWWRKITLSLLDRFVDSSTDIRRRSSGALYCTLALSYIHPMIREAYPFLQSL